MTEPPDKARQMKLRRQGGTHEWPAEAFWPRPGVPGRGGAYLVAHACFACRRSVKVHVGYWQRREARCPECAGALHWLGRTFRAPKRSDIKQWKKVEALWQAGFRFNTYGGKAEPLPETFKEAGAFIVRHRATALDR